MKVSKALIWVLVVILVILCAVVVLLENRTFEKEPQTQTTEPSGAYTWEEYQALSLEEQDAFFQKFDSVDAFEAWMDAVKPVDTTALELEWNKSGKEPNEYTWEEYQALTAWEQDAFFAWFESENEFTAWMDAVKPEETTEPVLSWDKQNKEPSAYTWEEYQALSQKEQDAFYMWFGSEAAFEAWMNAVKPEETTEPLMQWDKPGKEPDAYTWEEYQTLTPEEQDAFYLWFESEAAFEAWVNAVKPEETTEPLMLWDKPGKEPDQYTWEEYQKLSPEEQDAFYRWFDSLEAFETWMEAAMPAESTEPALEWDKEKNPDQYTWEEYQMLSPEEQDAFFQWFGSVDAFEAWMEAAKGTSA